MEKYFRRLSVFKFIGLLLLGVFITVIAVMIVPFNRDGTASLSEETVWMTFISSIVMYAAWLLFIWYGSLSKDHRTLILTPAPARSPRNIWFALAALLWSLPVNFIYSTFLERFFPDFLEQMMEAGNLPENMLIASDPLSLLLMFIPVVILAPIVEEIIFRGVLYNLLNKRMSLPLAALISSLIFGIMHGSTFFQTAVIGLILAFVYQVTGDLRMAMLGHGLNNGVAFLQGILLEAGLLDQGSMGEMILAGILLLGSATILIMTILYLRRNPLRSIYRDSAPIYKHEIASNQAAFLEAEASLQEGIREQERNPGDKTLGSGTRLEN